jgi:hypothetical protein
LIVILGVYFHTIEPAPGDPSTGMTALMLAAHFGDAVRFSSLFLFKIMF